MSDHFDTSFADWIVILTNPQWKVILAFLHYYVRCEINFKDIENLYNIRVFGEFFKNSKLSFEIVCGGVNLLNGNIFWNNFIFVVFNAFTLIYGPECTVRYSFPDLVIIHLLIQIFKNITYMNLSYFRWLPIVLLEMTEKLIMTIYK